MKYEAVFGDQSLFFDAHRDCEMVGNGHHKVENGKLMVWNFSEKYWAESYTNKITIAAMRRIIAEPKRWTVEDQKAGRLPEVGSLVEWNDCGVKLKVTIESAFFNKNCAFSFEGRGIGIAEIFDLSPIETPAEKAQREEDEFISSLRSVEIHDGTVSGFFNQGARAAYRKLKGGE